VGVSNMASSVLVSCRSRHFHCLAAHHQVLLPNGLYRRVNSCHTSIHYLSDLCLALLLLPGPIPTATALGSRISSLTARLASFFFLF
jgi:hypothetical protein